MVVKRKTTTRIANDADAATKHIEEDPAMDAEEEEEEEEEEVQESEKDRVKRIEEETVAARTKELKFMAVEKVKALLVGDGFEVDGMKKDDMVTKLLAHEAKVRAAQRAKAAMIREVIVKKKEELEALSYTDLCKAGNEMGIEGRMEKTERIRLMLASWQKDDGVEKALKEIARQERLTKLQSMEIDGLRRLCKKNGIDPYVKEVMVDRAVKLEKKAGRFKRPTLQDKKEAPENGKADDLVATLIANEACRKAMLKKQVEKEEAKKAKIMEWTGLSIDELKKRLKKHGSDVDGNKNELVQALYAIYLEEEAVNERKSELKAMALADLKSLASEKAIECGHSKDKIVHGILEHESKCREELKAFDAKASVFLSQKKEELEWKTNTELKDMCFDNNLAVGGGKEDRIARLLEQAQTEICRKVSALMMDQRKEELLKMERKDVVALCEELGADLYVKEIMIERVLAFEEEEEEEEEDDEPPAKKARR